MESVFRAEAVQSGSGLLEVEINSKAPNEQVKCDNKLINKTLETALMKIPSYTKSQLAHLLQTLSALFKTNTITNPKEDK